MRKAAYQLLETLYDRDSQDLCDIDRLVGEVATNGLSDPDEEILSLNLDPLEADRSCQHGRAFKSRVVGSSLH